MIVRSHTYKADFSNDIGGKFTFSKSDDIFTIKSLIKAISALSIEKIATIQEYLEYQLETLFDKTQVMSISQSFEYISQNTNNILNESFFEIDSETFIADFQKKMNTSDVIHISSLSVEEGKYCILNQLHKICPDKQVYIIRSKDNWDKAGKYLSGCILIPDFQADEIPASKNNITLFIENANKNRNALRIPKRTTSFLLNKLKDSGYDDPYKLLQKTHGLYYYIKIELFTGKIRHPGWEKDNDKAVIVAALLEKWSECDGDKSVIENLYGDSYDQFISYLDQYMGIEEAFIVRKNYISYDVIYELADPFLAVYSHRSVVNLPIIKAFLNLTKSVLSAFKNPNCSNSLKSGITRTLILLALYADFQGKISYFVKDLLTMIHSIKDWVYISQFIESLCEASPDAVVDCLENSIDNHTGLLDLFTAEKTDILMGQHYYTHILWCLERLLPCKDYAVRVVIILFELGDKIDKCSIGKSPRYEIFKVFCTWYNVSALEIEEKIELARMGVEKYPYFWDILYNEIGKNTTISGNSSFIYRDTDKIVQYTRGDIFNFHVLYTQILLSNIEDNLERLVKLLDFLPQCTDELFTAIQNELLSIITDLCDFDKEQIKTTLRKTIYHHRCFANSKWAASSERISKIEELCLSITFDDQAYDFLYLTESGDIPIFHPIAYDSEGDYYQKNKNAIEEVIESEMIRLKELGVDLGHYLELSNMKSTYKISRALAKYYCNSKYDEKVLDIIINSTDNPQIAVDYVCNCSDSDLTEVYKAMEYLQNAHYADKFYVAFLLALPFNEKSRSFVFNLPDKAAQKYWTQFMEYRFNSKDLLNKAITNLLKYNNWDNLYCIMHEQAEMLSVGEILTIISDSTKKMIAENHQIDHNKSYFIVQILSVVYQRIGNDFESYPILFELEMRLYSVIGWENMKCCQYLFKRNANLYADILLSLVYKKDDDNSDDRLDSDTFMHFYTLERDIKFCPGEENDSINKDVLNEWIVLFNNRLENQGQASLFYRKLGKLFASSPTGSDGLFPHESVREKIEEIGNDDLINAFADSIICGRGVYNITGGKDEYKLGQKYGELSRRFSIRYPKTSKIFNIISRSFFNESEHERKSAENDIY